MLTNITINYSIVTQFAGVVELVDTEDLKSSGLNSCTGSSPVSGSNYKRLTEWLTIKTPRFSCYGFYNFQALL